MGRLAYDVAIGLDPNAGLGKALRNDRCELGVAFAVAQLRASTFADDQETGSAKTFGDGRIAFGPAGVIRAEAISSRDEGSVERVVQNDWNTMEIPERPAPGSPLVQRRSLTPQMVWIAPGEEIALDLLRKELLRQGLAQLRNPHRSFAEPVAQALDRRSRCPVINGHRRVPAGRRPLGGRCRRSPWR